MLKVQDFYKQVKVSTPAAIEMTMKINNLQQSDIFEHYLIFDDSAHCEQFQFVSKAIIVKLTQGNSIKIFSIASLQPEIIGRPGASILDIRGNPSLNVCDIFQLYQVHVPKGQLLISTLRKLQDDFFIE
ncbi:MAG: hypothetical protein EZS28_004681 [Streblomastix strix]|uniref:Uncharacterized protein n=1 Tax=Streblomastix strix TaxID=222440 RepID=A0A5J4WY50_9EUKA|nr:MAG: hypothetical protein EZS28_004681 [Streblomastix strix]